jgi:double-strand break repair protein MRE11
MPVPLSQVRSFEIGEVSLQDQAKLNPLDPKIDDKIMLFLAEKVQALIAAAREKNNLVLRDSAVAAGIPLSGNEELDEDQLVSHKLKYRLEKPDQVLVRLKVEHTGFNSINNQRFGARFVEDVVRLNIC